MFFGGQGVNMANMRQGGATFSFGGAPGFSSATFVGPGFRARSFNNPGQQYQQAQPQQPRSGWTILMQILPLILLFGYTLFTGLSDETPIFSFQSTSVYSQPRMTSSHHVPYYVDPNAFKPYSSNNHKLSKVEQQVEVDWVRSLQQTCLYERKQQQTKLNNARGAFGFLGRDEKQYKAALEMKLKSCDELKRFGYK